MKIVCSCGIKYGFDTSPEMVRRPVRFVCQSCGADHSDVVNQMIREEHGATESAAEAPAAPVVAPAPPPPRPVSPPPPQSRPAVSVPAPTPVSRVRIASHTETPAPAAASSPSQTQTQYCGKHPGQEVAASCVVCHKPMCPLCMQVTGFVCSPFCRTKAEAQGIVIPEYEGQSHVTSRREWRKVSLVVGAIAAVIVAGLGFWFWYAWIGSAPRVAYSHKFPADGESGRMHLAVRQQLIVLHGGTLTRHDLETGKLVWSLQLLDTNRIATESSKEWEKMKAAWAEELKNGADGSSYRLPTLERFTRDNIAQAAATLSLHVEDQNIWLNAPGKLTRYAWADGKSDKEVTVDESFDAEPKRTGQELVFVGEGIGGKESSLRVNLVSGDNKAEGLAESKTTAAAKPGAKASTTTAKAETGTKPIDPAAVAERAQNLPKANRLALPATIAAAENQRRLAAAMRDDNESAPRRPAARKPVNPEVTERIRTANGIVEFSTRLLEERLVQREAMRAAPTKSALDGDVNASATTAIANELLNEMQRERSSTVTENESRYQVTVRRGQAIQPWTGEVVGEPSFHPLKTIDLVASGKGVLALDKNNKKLWDAKLNYLIGSAGFDGPDLDDTEESGLSTGAGPFIERNDVIYVIDQGMLTSFARADGKVRWRLPSVGISGIFFDDQGNLYLNSTTASPDAIKYAKQIDVSTKVTSQVLKVEPETGKTLWAALNEGMVTYIWGKVVYTVESHMGDDFDEDEDARVLGVKTGFEIPPHIRLKRLDAGNGRVLWEHYQGRYPLDVHFDRNTIQLLFKKEVQHLRFIML